MYVYVCVCVYAWKKKMKSEVWNLTERKSQVSINASNLFWGEKPYRPWQANIRLHSCLFLSPSCLPGCETGCTDNMFSLHVFCLITAAKHFQGVWSCLSTSGLNRPGAQCTLHPPLELYHLQSCCGYDDFQVLCIISHYTYILYLIREQWKKNHRNLLLLC